MKQFFNFWCFIFSQIRLFPMNTKVLLYSASLLSLAMFFIQHDTHALVHVYAQAFYSDPWNG